MEYVPSGTELNVTNPALSVWLVLFSSIILMDAPISGSRAVPLTILSLTVDCALIVVFREISTNMISRNLFVILKQGKKRMVYNFIN
jgi:hypothetical protein